MSGEFTKVGPPDKHDFPRKKSGFFGTIWRGSLLAGMFTSLGSGPFGIFRALAISKTMEVEERVEAEEQAEAEAKHPWHGLHEAELSEEERNLAARRLAQEEALRKARGD